MSAVSEPATVREGRVLPRGQWRLLAPALVGWAACALAVCAPGSGLWLAMLGAAGALALCVLALRRRQEPLRLLAVTVGVLLVLGCRVHAGEQVRADPGLASVAREHRQVEFPVTVESYPRVRAASADPRGTERGAPGGAQGRRRVTVQGRIATASGDVPAIVWVAEPTPGAAPREREPPAGRAQDARAPAWNSVGPGTKLLIAGTAVQLEPQSAYAFGIRATRVSRAGTGSGPGPGWADRVEAEVSAWLQGVRSDLVSAAQRIPGAQLVPGFAIGNTDLVSADTEAKLRATSLLHLLAVSGANCALVTGTAVWCLSWLRVPRRARILCAGIVLAGFIALVGPDQSVQRAAIMAAVLLVAQFGGRAGHSLPALAAAILVLLTADPWQALAPGFGLSVAATGGILLLVPGLDAGMARFVRLPAAIRKPLVVAMAAELSVAPILLTMDDGLPLAGVVANVVAGLAAPLGTGLGLLAAVILPISEACALPLLHLAALPSRWVTVTAEVASSLPLARIPWPGGWGGAALLLGIVVSSWGAHLVRRAGLLGRGPWMPTPLLSGLRLAVVAALAAAAIGGFAGPTVVGPLTATLSTPRDWRIVACDIGQGDAVALRGGGPGGPVMLVDTGDDEQKLTRCLERFGIDRIELLVLTHDDRDHVGALPAVAGRCARAMISIPSREHVDRRPLVNQLERFALPFTQGYAGQSGSLPSDGAEHGIQWEVLAPPETPTPAETNAASQIMRVRVDELTALMLADSGREQHRALLRTGADLTADVVKVAHHGSSDQDPRVLEASGASLGLISVGADNSYGHPTRGALEGLARAGIRALRTDQYGSIAVSGPSGALDVWVEHPDGAQGGRDEYVPHPSRGGASQPHQGRVPLRRRSRDRLSRCSEMWTASGKNSRSDGSLGFFLRERCSLLAVQPSPPASKRMPSSKRWRIVSPASRQRMVPKPRAPAVGSSTREANTRPRSHRCPRSRRKHRPRQTRPRWNSGRSSTGTRSERAREPCASSGSILLSAASADTATHPR